MGKAIQGLEWNKGQSEYHEFLQDRIDNGCKMTGLFVAENYKECVE